MSQKSQIRVVLTNILLFGVLYGLVSLNKAVLRPAVGQISWMEPITGSFPNFIAAYILSFFFVNAAVILEPKHSRLLVYLGSLFIFALLTFEEVNSMWGASEVYDVLDIIASGAGSLLAIASYELIILKRKPGATSART